MQVSGGATRFLPRRRRELGGRRDVNMYSVIHSVSVFCVGRPKGSGVEGHEMIKLRSDAPVGAREAGGEGSDVLRPVQ
jgi:hypothetical protein